MRRFAAGVLIGLVMVAGCTESDDAASPVADLGVDGGVGDGAAPRLDRGTPDAAPPAPADGAPPADAAAGADAAAPGPDAAPPPPGVAPVSHPRELRAVWVASVWNINFPSRAGLSADAQQAELLAILDAAAAMNLNAVFLQVRPEADALYASELEPWSRFLTGTQGQDPGWDPLAVAVREAHARNLELHAWLNPYRAQASAQAAVAADHPVNTLADSVRAYGTQTFLDPGAPEARAHTVAVARDIVRRYAVDGVHFDDYFYPYPDGAPFPDDATWQAYVDGGGALGRDDWRRDNVNQLIQQVFLAVREEDPAARFGVGPFGIYRPGTPPGTAGLDQYAAIYADPVHWMQEGWVDYLAPQLYWNATRPQQDYETLLTWWASLTWGGRYIAAGNNLAKLGEDAGWSVAEFERQVGISRALRAEGSLGNVFFHVGPFVADQDGVATTLRERFYAAPALTPPLPGTEGETLPPPTVERSAGALTLSHGADDLRAWTLYRDAGAGWTLDRIVPAYANTVAVGSGRWAVAAVDRRGVESGGVVVQVE